jgi:hypothetical protein
MRLFVVLFALCVAWGPVQAWEMKLFQEESAFQKCVQEYDHTELRFFWTTPHASSAIQQAPEHVWVGGNEKWERDFKTALQDFLIKTEPYKQKFRVVLTLDAFTHMTNPWLAELGVGFPHFRLRPLEDACETLKALYPGFEECLETVYTGPPVVTSDIDRLLGADTLLTREQAQNAHITYADIDLFVRMNQFGARGEQSMEALFFVPEDKEMLTANRGLAWFYPSGNNDLIVVSLKGEGRSAFRELMRTKALPDLQKNLFAVRQLQIRYGIERFCDLEGLEHFFSGIADFMQGKNRNYSSVACINEVAKVSGRMWLRRIQKLQTHVPKYPGVFAGTWYDKVAKLEVEPQWGLDKEGKRRWGATFQFYRVFLARVLSALQWGTLSQGGMLYQKAQKFFSAHNPLYSPLLKEVLGRSEDLSEKRQALTASVRETLSKPQNVFASLSKDLKKMGITWELEDPEDYVARIIPLGKPSSEIL